MSWKDAKLLYKCAKTFLCNFAAASETAKRQQLLMTVHIENICYLTNSVYLRLQLQKRERFRGSHRGQ